MTEVAEMVNCMDSLSEDKPSDSHLKPKSIVWAKLTKFASCWWPVKVISLSECPEEITNPLRKEPLAVVKFFEEECYDVIKYPEHIYPFLCSRRAEFLLNGRALEEKEGDSSDYVRDKFEDDYVRACEMVGVDSTFVPTDEKTASYANGDAKTNGNDVEDTEDYSSHVTSGGSGITARISSVNKSNVAKTRFIKNGCSIEIRCQPVINYSQSGMYTCDVCGHQTSRLNNIISHHKGHADTLKYNLSKTGSIYGDNASTTLSNSASRVFGDRKISDIGTPKPLKKSPVKRKIADKDSAPKPKSPTKTERESTNKSPSKSPAKSKAKKQARSGSEPEYDFGFDDITDYADGEAQRATADKTADPVEGKDGGDQAKPALVDDEDVNKLKEIRDILDEPGSPNLFPENADKDNDEEERMRATVTEAESALEQLEDSSDEVSFKTTNEPAQPDEQQDASQTAIAMDDASMETARGASIVEEYVATTDQDQIAYAQEIDSTDQVVVLREGGEEVYCQEVIYDEYGNVIGQGPGGVIVVSGAQGVTGAIEGDFVGGQMVYTEAVGGAECIVLNAEGEVAEGYEQFQDESYGQ